MIPARAPCHTEGWAEESKAAWYKLTEEYIVRAQTGTARHPGAIAKALFSESVSWCSHLWWHGRSGNLKRSDRRITSTDQFCKCCNKYSKAEAFDDLGVKFHHEKCSPLFKHYAGCRSSACVDMPCIVCLLMLCCGAWLLMHCPCCKGLRADDTSSERMRAPCSGERSLCSKVYVMCFYGCECGCRVAESMEP